MLFRADRSNSVGNGLYCKSFARKSFPARTSLVPWPAENQHEHKPLSVERNTGVGRMAFSKTGIASAAVRQMTFPGTDDRPRVIARCHPGIGGRRRRRLRSAAADVQAPELMYVNGGAILDDTWYKMHRDCVDVAGHATCENGWYTSGCRFTGRYLEAHSCLVTQLSGDRRSAM